jgi:hypothetical protein
MRRRDFLQIAGIGGVFGLGAEMALAAGSPIISPGCRGTKVRVGKAYLGVPRAHWPTPLLDLEEEVSRYEGEFRRLSKELADVEFVGNVLITSQEGARRFRESIGDVDGILLIHLSMGIWNMLLEILAARKPTVLFAAPYSGHEWTGFGSLRKQKEGSLLECILTSDLDQLSAAIRPFRAIHHLREAKILNVTTNDFSSFAGMMKEKFGTEIIKISRDRVLEAYNSIPDGDAREEARRWIEGAEKVVEPSEDEIFRSCKLALALQKIADEENAVMVTVDCYGSMWRQLPAYPCISHARMNSIGLGGMCESDLRAAMTQLIIQGLSGRPGFCNDPTMDLSRNAIILAHCMGTPKMDGPEGKAAPYRLRSVMERQEGATPQVFMDVGRKTTSAILANQNLIHYFTGEIIEAPDLPRGCRTKIVVRVDGDAERLWQNWSHGLHRVTCYGDISKDLERFCRFNSVQLVNEAT